MALQVAEELKNRAARRRAARRQQQAAAAAVQEEEKDKPTETTPPVPTPAAAEEGTGTDAAVTTPSPTPPVETAAPTPEPERPPPPEREERAAPPSAPPAPQQGATIQQADNPVDPGGPLWGDQYDPNRNYDNTSQLYNPNDPLHVDFSLGIDGGIRFRTVENEQAILDSGIDLNNLDQLQDWFEVGSGSIFQASRRFRAWERANPDATEAQKRNYANFLSQQITLRTRSYTQDVAGARRRLQEEEKRRRGDAARRWQDHFDRIDRERAAREAERAAREAAEAAAREAARRAAEEAAREAALEVAAAAGEQVAEGGRRLEEEEDDDDRPDWWYLQRGYVRVRRQDGRTVWVKPEELEDRVDTAGDITEGDIGNLSTLHPQTQSYQRLASENPELLADGYSPVVTLDGERYGWIRTYTPTAQPVIGIRERRRLEEQGIFLDEPPTPTEQAQGATQEGTAGPVSPEGTIASPETEQGPEIGLQSQELSQAEHIAAYNAAVDAYDTAVAELGLNPGTEAWYREHNFRREDGQWVGTAQQLAQYEEAVAEYDRKVIALGPPPGTTDWFRNNNWTENPDGTFTPPGAPRTTTTTTETVIPGQTRTYRAGDIFEFGRPDTRETREVAVYPYTAIDAGLTGPQATTTVTPLPSSLEFGALAPDTITVPSEESEPQPDVLDDFTATDRAPIVSGYDLETVTEGTPEDVAAAISNNARVNNEQVWADWQERKTQERIQAGYDTGEAAEQAAGQRALELLQNIDEDNFYQTLEQIKASGVREVQVSGQWVPIERLTPAAAGAAAMDDRQEGLLLRDPATLTRIEMEQDRTGILEREAATIREGVAAGTLSYGERDLPDVVTIERPRLQAPQHTEGAEGAADVRSTERRNQQLLDDYQRRMDEATGQGKLVAIVEPPPPGQDLYEVAQILVPGLGLFEVTRQAGRDKFITPAEANQISTELALSTLDVTPAPIAGAAKSGLTITRIAGPTRLGGGFISGTADIGKVHRIRGPRYDPATLEAADVAAEQLATTGRAEVTLRDQPIVYHQSELDRAIREANPDADLTLTTTAAPDVETFAPGGEIPPFHFPDPRAAALEVPEVAGTLPRRTRAALEAEPSASAGELKPEREQFQFRTPGGEGSLQFTRRGAFGGTGRSGGFAVYATDYADLVRPGQPSDPLGTKYFGGGREVEFGVPTGEVIPPVRRIGGLGEEFQTGLYLDEGLRAPTYTQRVRANLRALRDRPVVRPEEPDVRIGEAAAETPALTPEQLPDAGPGTTTRRADELEPDAGARAADELEPDAGARAADELEAEDARRRSAEDLDELTPAERRAAEAATTGAAARITRRPGTAEELPGAARVTPDSTGERTTPPAADIDSAPTRTTPAEEAVGAPRISPPSELDLSRILTVGDEPETIRTSTTGDAELTRVTTAGEDDAARITTTTDDDSSRISVTEEEPETARITTEEDPEVVRITTEEDPEVVRITTEDDDRTERRTEDDEYPFRVPPRQPPKLPPPTRTGRRSKRPKRDEDKDVPETDEHPFVRETQHIEVVRVTKDWDTRQTRITPVRASKPVITRRDDSEPAPGRRESGALDLYPHDDGRKARWQAQRPLPKRSAGRRARRGRRSYSTAKSAMGGRRTGHPVRRWS